MKKLLLLALLVCATPAALWAGNLQITGYALQVTGSVLTFGTGNNNFVSGTSTGTGGGGGGGAPTTIRIDSFTDTNGTALGSHTPDAGTVWGGGNIADFAIQSSALHNNTAGFRRTLGSDNPSSANYFVEMIGQTGATGGGDIVGVMGRFTEAGGGDYYQSLIRGTGSWETYRAVAGSEILLSSGTIAGFSAVTDYKLRLTMTGTTIKTYVNDVLVDSTVDVGGPSAANNAGVLSDAGNAAIDFMQAKSF